MSKIGINLKIDVTKIDKSRLYQGEKGVYLNVTTVIDTDGVGNYGDHGIINQSTTKEEREAKIQMPILGNARIFFSTLSESPKTESPSKPPSQEFDDAVPF